MAGGGVAMLFQQMGNKKTQDGAKAGGNFLQKLQNADPFTKIMDTFDKAVSAALPFAQIQEMVGESFSIWGDAVTEGFAPAMEAIMTTLTTPEVLEAMTQIGTAFSEIFVQLQPLVEMLLPALIWIIKLVANVIIFVIALVYDIVVTFINIIIVVVNMFLWIYNNVILGILNLFGAGIAQAEYVQTFKLMEVNWVPMATGGTFVTSGPTPILAGEGGAERVTVTPLGEETSGGGITVIVNVSGSVITERDLETTIRRTVDDVAREYHLLK